MGEKPTLSPAKNSSRSGSFRSNAKLPTKAVKGGSVGSGRSSRGGPRSAGEMMVVS